MNCPAADSPVQHGAPERRAYPEVLVPGRCTMMDNGDTDERSVKNMTPCRGSTRSNVQFLWNMKIAGAELSAVIQV
jgi:hypothetical protein